MSAKESLRDYIVALSLLPFLNSKRTRLLRSHFDPLDDAAKAPRRLLASLLRLDLDQAELVKDPLRTAGPRFASFREQSITIIDELYPPPLREIADPPLNLFYRGDPSILAAPSLAVVGSRKASPYAINVAEQLAGTLAAAGMTIVSGLALGIDAAAHAAALAAGGTTIAVLGTGVDLIYPEKNRALAERIAGRGLLLSEFPPGTPPLAMNFPVRNRVIAGLTLGTVVVEATSKSGSLITARLALEQNREVFAVPGSIFSAGSEGTHRLVQSGAKLVHDAQDILDELQLDLKLPPLVAPAEPDDPHLRDVLATLARDEAIHIDAITSSSTLPMAAVSEALLQLELAGWIRAVPGARFVRAR